MKLATSAMKIQRRMKIFPAQSDTTVPMELSKEFTVKNDYTLNLVNWLDKDCYVVLWKAGRNVTVWQMYFKIILV